MPIHHDILFAALTLASLGSERRAEQREGWDSLPVPEWSASGMMDRTGRIDDGRIVSAWFRFVDVPGRPSAEEDPEVIEIVKDGRHVDLRASVDCATMRFRVEGTRIARPDGTIQGIGLVPAGQAFWTVPDRHSRGDAMRRALCAGGRRRS